jgi:hypothetical protein
MSVVKPIDYPVIPAKAGEEMPPTRRFVTPEKTAAQTCPWQATGSKRLKSLDSRLRGNDGMSPRPFLHSSWAGLAMTLRGVTIPSGGL